MGSGRVCIHVIVPAASYVGPVLVMVAIPVMAAPSYYSTTMHKFIVIVGIWNLKKENKGSTL